MDSDNSFDQKPGAPVSFETASSEDLSNMDDRQLQDWLSGAPAGQLAEITDTAEGPLNRARLKYAVAAVLMARAEVRPAMRMYAQAAAIYRRLGKKKQLACCCDRLAAACVIEGKLNQARQLYKRR